MTMNPELAAQSGGIPSDRSHARLNGGSLPFTVRIVRNEEQLNKAVYIRSEAYGRHWPNLMANLQKPETQDRDPNSLIILAESKADGGALGTMRIDTNLTSPLQLEYDIQLPPEISSSPIAYVTRMGVKQGRLGSLVKLSLFKSLHRYCLAKQLGWILAGVRPPNDRDYVRLGFHDLIEEAKLVPITSSGGVPVRLMAFEVRTAERNWHTAGNPLYEFMFKAYHPDIEIFSSVNGMWAQPRRTRSTVGPLDSPVEDLGIPLL